MSLAEIESLCKPLSDARSQLAAVMTELNAAVEQIKRQKIPQIKRLVAKAAEHQAALNAAIDNSRGLFVKPRTVIFHGVQCGLGKGRGGIHFADADRVCELIKKLFPKKKDLLINTTEKPDKNALKSLDVGELKRLGCTVEDTGDVIVIRFTDSEVDKAVNALLADAIATETSAEEAA